MKIIRLITVYTKKTIENDIPEIGLFSTDNGSEFHWSEVPIAPSVGSFAPILTSVGDKTTKLDLGTGGNIEQYSTINFSVVNLAQINVLMEDLDFPIIGSRVICEDYYPDTEEFKRIYTGMIDTFSADDRELHFDCEAWENVKDRNLTSKIISGSEGNFPFAPTGVNGQIIPLCIGESDPKNGIYFKIPCIKNIFRILSQQDILNLLPAHLEYQNFPSELDVFPVADQHPAADDLHFIIRLGNVNVFDTQPYFNNLIGKYLYIKTAPVNEDEGQEISYENELRKITGVEYSPNLGAPAYGAGAGEYAALTIIIDKIVRLFGNFYANHQYQSYVQFIDKALSEGDPALYQWMAAKENIGFKNEPEFYYGNEHKRLLTTGFNLSVFSPISVSYPIEQPDKDELYGFKILSVPAIEAIVDLDDLSKYKDPVFSDEGEPWDDLSNFVRKGSSPGYYVNDLHTGYESIAVTVNNDEMSSDPDNRDYYKYRYSSTSVHSWPDGHFQNIRAFRFTLPEIDFDFNEAYIGVSIECNCEFTFPPMIGLKKYMGQISWAIADLDMFNNVFKLDDMPDSFYTNHTDNNENFFGEGSRTNDKWTHYARYKNYLLENIGSRKDYIQHNEGLIFFPRGGTSGSSNFTETLKIRKLCLIFKSKAEIGDYLYV